MSDSIASQARPDFDPPLKASERMDFPNVEVVLDQMADADPDVVVEIIARLAIWAIGQRDRMREVAQRALGLLHDKQRESEAHSRRIADLCAEVRRLREGRR